MMNNMILCNLWLSRHLTLYYYAMKYPINIPASSITHTTPQITINSQTLAHTPSHYYKFILDILKLEHFQIFPSTPSSLLGRLSIYTVYCIFKKFCEKHKRYVRTLIDWKLILYLIIYHYCPSQVALKLILELATCD